jgi:hypothetical protein
MQLICEMRSIQNLTVIYASKNKEYETGHYFRTMHVFTCLSNFKTKQSPELFPEKLGYGRTKRGVRNCGLAYYMRK